MIYGNPITLGGGSVVSVPEMFGDGSDGLLYVAAGATITLDVTSPYESVVEKNYEKIIIESGGTLVCSANNAGLVLRCRGECIIDGTIDQSCKSPLPNPNNDYDYPEEITCGDGGTGGNSGQGSGSIRAYGVGGTGMAAMKYGGGWSGGGAGGRTTYSNDGTPGSGGSVNGLTIANANDALFVGATVKCGNGSNGGGGAATNTNTSNGKGCGGTGAGANGGDGDSFAGGGGAGNYGGGIVLLYCGADLTINGSILCNGGKGGNGGNYASTVAGQGGGGGGAGGGAIYIVHNGEYTNNGVLNVNGGAAGSGGLPTTSAYATAGGLGSIIVKPYMEGMTK